jgi:uncharacterized membrane protein YhhN
MITQGLAGISWVLLAAAGALSAANVVAVWRSQLRLEYVVKPAVMLALIGVAITLHPQNQAERALFVAALVLGLASDVFLMLPQDLFLPGLVAALIEHLAYVAGFRFGALAVAGVFIGLVIVIAAAAALVPRLGSALTNSGHGRLRGPVIAYAVVISVMTISATGSGSLVAAAGGLLFFASDALLAWYRFVGPLPWGRPVNIAAYQLGQALLVLSLAI